MTTACDDPTDLGSSIFPAYLNLLIGCRTEEVTFDVDFAEVRKKLSATQNEGYVIYAAKEKATEGALAKAISKLGDDGWEMVNPGFRFSVDVNARAIYFKRRK